jgi:hypothetical protein
MKYFVALVMVAALAVPAMAGQNENCYVYVSFDPAGDPGQTELTTTAGVVTGYVCVGGISEVPGEGLRGISFALDDPTVNCAGAFVTKEFVNLLPGDLAIGSVFGDGISLSSTDCMPGPVVVVASIGGYFVGGACCIEVLDHAAYPRWVVDCQTPGVVDYYCVQSHGVINGGTCATAVDDPCPDVVPVEDATWGGIKALYN